MKYIYITSKVEARIEALKKNGKAGTSLAKKADRIIESLTSGTTRHNMDANSSFTKHGEKRIRNCRKYDLGCGYRLVTLQRDETLFIPFLGTHDECHRWLESNSRLKNFNAGTGKLIHVAGKKLETTTPKESKRIDSSADDDLFKHLTDKDLRRVFSGLVEGAKKQSR